MQIREIQCKTALSKCGFPGGGLAINPYVGCGHSCVYCYARFMKRFTNHTEAWGTFVDVRVNITEVLNKELKSAKHKGQQIHIGTVTDPYQPLEKKYQLTRKILQNLIGGDNPVSILTKSDLILRDIDLLKQIKNVEINFTVNTLDERWQKLVEPGAPTVTQRLAALAKLTQADIAVAAMLGPYWPVFTDPEALFKEFQRVGVKHVFSESVNTLGGNWTGVAQVLKKNYPKLLPEMQNILFDPKKFYTFYNAAQNKIQQLSQQYKIPVTVYFDRGHAAKSK